ncbi:hybrid sensor histidine kinase/response regulator [Carboxylicivirga sp. M1479]|uniref:hybrid sensor histidine kinase/response regulator n=1 Tax=Carboxylicivirga sp. M1479 TaxID=2594476 RepID=UPI00163D9555|nr:hybrid sensor histidine kinase/response regulator [Carboxylicivirga sp. M1479]
MNGIFISFKTGKLQFTCHLTIKKFILYVLLLLISKGIMARDMDLKFRHLSIEEGLSNNNITSILKDSKGFVWVGTFDGLNRYDGYDFHTIKNYSGAELQLSSNIVNCLFEDSHNNLWIGTMGGGVNRLDASRSKVSIFQYQEQEIGISSNHIFDLAEDRNGNIWMATGDGLNKYNPQTEEFTLFSEIDGLNSDNLMCLVVDDEQLLVGSYGGGINVIDIETESVSTFKSAHGVLSNDLIWDLFIDSTGTLWVATEKGGLFSYDSINDSYQYFLKKEGSYNFLNNSFPVSIQEDKKQRLWITTDQGGFYCYNLRDSSMVNYRNNPLLGESIKSNALTKVLVDDCNYLWLGTYDKGLCVSNLNQEGIVHLNHRYDQEFSLSDKSINSIYEDSDGDIWIGSENGLNRADKDFIIQKQYFLEHGLSDNVSLTTVEIGDKELWIGTYTGGITIYNKQNDSFRSIGRTNDSTGLSSDFVRSIYEDSDGLIWVGTVRGGVDIYNPNTGFFKNFSNASKQGTYLNSSNVLSIIEDDEANMWLATYGGGINKYSKKDSAFTYFEHDKKIVGSLSSNQATCQLIDSKGDYWVGTSFGLNKMNADQQSFTNYFVEDGLTSNSIVGLVEDNNQNLWITTQNGLSVYNLNTGVFTNFYKEDGLQENVFHYNAITKLKNGSIVCGGINGMNVFDANEPLENRLPHRVVITSLSIFNKMVMFGTEVESGRKIYEGEISEAQNIYLSHIDKLFELNYSTLEYRNPKQTNYLYMIDELHDEWINLGNKNSISFHNLSPDDYTFRIKSSIANGRLQSEETVLNIHIQPPFYATTWFYVLVVVVLVSLTFAAYYLKNKNTRRQRKVLEQTVRSKTKELWELNQNLEKHKNNLEKLVDERTKDLKSAKEKAEKADALKTAFLANMSHEIRTPMNAILGFADLLNDSELPREESNYFHELIQANSVTLMRLIDDIMDLARIESGDILINKTSFELNHEMDSICAIYKGEANAMNKGVVFNHNAYNEPIQVYTDVVRLKQIIVNLINNAIKFTEEGAITFNYSASDGMLQCCVQDSGIGIPAHEVGNIFNRFNKLDGYTEKVYRGTGLGLAITKELVKLLGGTIWVESKEGQGSTFFFTIRIDQ